MAKEDLKWFYDLATGKVFQGKVSGFETRMGPYDTEEEAHYAISIAAARTKAAEIWDDKED
ncbi:hypothetical protein [Corynebacterium glutamicum]|uniref:hypothetical protein n=1 Tax=Corynebacterium glutamicum TaxID=1718 RepID=UPI0004F671E3|nr:hypothetical protein [Corynebacterium glutamicum]AIK88449.1 hypothetical protein AR0_10645 [Corynebacterium glutamicum]OKX86921.1 hypothetical protein AUO96_07375 [Corynebacterium glutamicum]QDQ21408.1 SPOR domain-containing protein [Corynebacterium glutamicum]QDQ22447.1 SPOR domain-containing protein [Corynebacterium glutamicum]QDX76105.1 hypothetical protein AKL15_10270 [Corynebacterium glutamicum]